MLSPSHASAVPGDPSFMFKRIIRRLLRPLSRRVAAVVDARVAAAAHRIEPRIDAVEDRLANVDVYLAEIAQIAWSTGPRLSDAESTVVALQDDVAAIKSYVPTILNTISTQNAAAREAKRSELRLDQLIRALSDELAAVRSDVGEHLTGTLAQIERRAEFIRQEVLFELRYRTGQHSDQTPIEPKVVDPQKLASVGDRIRLNLGSGHIPVDGYLNVDSRDLPGIDIVADIRRLPFEPEQVSELFSAHMLEHFPVEELSRSLLPYWYSLLRPGGIFAAVVPDSETMLAEYSAGRLSFDDLRLVTFGGQEYEGDFHFNMFTKDSFRTLLEAAGFVDVLVTASGRRNGACYEMEITAAKPSGRSDGRARARD